MSAMPSTSRPSTSVGWASRPRRHTRTASWYCFLTIRTLPRWTNSKSDTASDYPLSLDVVGRICGLGGIGRRFGHARQGLATLDEFAFEQPLLAAPGPALLGHRLVDRAHRVEVPGVLHPHPRGFL